MRKYSFRKPRRKVGRSEHVGSIFIFDSEEEWERNDLQQQQKGPSQQEDLIQEQIPEKV